jgi:hypothetical protein
VKFVGANPSDGGGAKRKATGSGRRTRGKKPKAEKEAPESKEPRKLLIVPSDAVYHADKVRICPHSTVRTFSKLVVFRLRQEEDSHPVLDLAVGSDDLRQVQAREARLLVSSWKGRKGEGEGGLRRGRD